MTGPKTYFIGQVLQPGEFPVVEDIYRIDAAGGWRWFVVHSNPKLEVKAAQSLRENGLKSFLPTTRSWAIQHRQKVVRVRPLFPRYLFAGCPVDARGDVDIFAPTRCDGVHEIVRGAGSPLAVKDEAIGDLMLYEERGWLDLTRDRQFQGQAKNHMFAGTFVDSMRSVMAAKPQDRIAVFLKLFEKRRATGPGHRM